MPHDATIGAASGRRSDPQMNNPAWIEMIGFTAACLTTSSFLPQALKIWRSRSARDVSLVMYLMMALGSGLWLTYGVLIGSPALMAANSTALALVLCILALKCRELLLGRPLTHPEA